MKHWTSLLPDLRGWAIAGFFALTFFTLAMIRENPALLANASFMQFVQQLSTGGLLLVASYLFGSSKSSSETNAKLVDAVAAGTTVNIPPGPSAVTVDTPPQEPKP